MRLVGISGAQPLGRDERLNRAAQMRAALTGGATAFEFGQ